MNPLRQLSDFGQSWWIDNLTRDMLRSGDLERRWRQDGLRGVTSNPAIFHKAISRGHAYDEQMHSLAAKGRSVQEIYEEIVTTDVRDACDVLRSLFDRTEGVHGHVSLEVSPHLAYDTTASISEARHLHEKVGRPNVYIKIPGTAPGVAAIEELLFQGIHVNVTLLFAIDAYEAVAEAYLRALERRLEAGRALHDISSVASFFLSRIDTLVDKTLESRIRTENGVGAEPRPQELLGKTAIANAKLAYQRYLAIVGSERWRRLAERGAHPQRLLWASTSTKNPRYSDVMYVEPLIGRDTVNTMPDETLAAFADHGKARADTVEEGIAEARAVLADLERLGIDLKAITDQLEREGVQKFIEPYDALLDLIAAKRG
ncbi:MAG: transaldolase [Thiohalomonadaceae bacterium]